MEMRYYTTMIKKKKTTEGAVSKSDKVDFRAKNITDGKKFYFIKSLIHQENLTILNIYAHNGVLK